VAPSSSRAKAIFKFERGQERRSARVALEIASHPFFAKLRITRGTFACCGR
jgi:hypothetical protein